ncbi:MULTISPECIES: hypothetical protein [Streptomyces]|uniref:hypothetical protein n=1 Tax=Streptomyces TaxID=1883 RepID=UPI0004CD1835|nr:hypothetical protein [Streptomyces durhamensis]
MPDLLDEQHTGVLVVVRDEAPHVRVFGVLDEAAHRVHAVPDAPAPALPLGRDRDQRDQPGDRARRDPR